VLADEIAGVETKLAADLARMAANGVTGADIAELMALHDQLDGIADELDAEGLHEQAAEVRELAAELAEVIAELAQQEATEEAGANNGSEAAADRAVVEKALAAAAADRVREAQDEAAATVGRDPSTRTPVVSIPTGRQK
jgi:peptidoglycan hydrolase CwlO-like protein